MKRRSGLVMSEKAYCFWAGGGILGRDIPRFVGWDVMADIACGRMDCLRVQDVVC